MRKAVFNLTSTVVSSLALLSNSAALSLNSSVSACLNMGTSIEAGLLVSDGDLIAAALACERARATPGSATTLMKIDVAHGAIDEEFRRRGASR